MGKITVLLLLIICFSIYRYYVYNKMCKFNVFGGEMKLNINPWFDEIYKKSLTKEKTIFSDYDKINLKDVGDSYNMCYMREFIFDNPNKATI